MSEATYWIEQGMLTIAGALAADPRGHGGVHAVASIVPPLRGLGRLWGAIDPSRAAGFASAVGHPFLRAYLRAAAMEFAAWPPVMSAGVLRRAEQDVLAAPGRTELQSHDAADLCDAIGLAWARAAASELPGADHRFRQPLLGTVASPLWRQEMLDRAAALRLLPDDRELPPGDLDTWFRRAITSLTSAQRARACLALAAACYADEHRQSSADDTVRPST